MEMNLKFDWSGIKELRFDQTIILRAPRDSSTKDRKLGTVWRGPPPEFRSLQWLKM